MCFVYDDKGQWPSDLLFPITPQHEVEFFGGGNENAKLLARILFRQHISFKAVDFQRRAYLLDNVADFSEVPSQAKCQLVDESTRRRKIRDPAAISIELV